MYKNEFLYKHFNVKLGYAKINNNSKTFTCHKYFDKGICKHLVAACLQVKVSLPGLEQLPKKFIPLHQETVEASQAEVHESEIQVPIEKKKGT